MWFFSSLLLAYKHDVLVHRHLCILRIHRPGREEFPGFLGQIPPIREGLGGRGDQEKELDGKREKRRMKGRKEGGEWRVGGNREEEEKGGARRERDEFYTLLWLSFILFPNHSLPPSLQTPPQSSCSSSTYVYTCKMVKFSSTLFIMYRSGRCFSRWMKLTMQSHIGERLIRLTNRPLSNLAYSVWREKSFLT